MEASNTDMEAGGGGVGGGRRRRRRRRRRRPNSSAGVSSETTTTTEGSLCFSDSDSDDNQQLAGLGNFSEIEGISNPNSHSHSHSHRVSSSVSECSRGDVDLESGELELKKLHSSPPPPADRNCRICHLKMVGRNQEIGIGGVAIELGCCCKGDLGAAHKKCAETWFNIKGNTTCEICGATALNVVVEHINEANSASTTAAAAAEPAGPVMIAETQRYCDGRRIMNFLLGCMVFAFVISWLFHFNVLS